MPNQLSKKLSYFFPSTGFVRSWRFWFHPVPGDSTVSLIFRAMVSGNGFRRAFEPIVIFQERGTESNLRSIVTKSKIDLDAVYTNDDFVFLDPEFESDLVEIRPEFLRGDIQQNKARFSWSIRKPAHADLLTDLIPIAVSKLKWISHPVFSSVESIRIDGKFNPNAEGDREFKNAPAGISFIAGDSYFHEWDRVNALEFKDQNGLPVPCSLECWRIRSHKWGILKTPDLYIYAINYMGRHFYFNSLRNFTMLKNKVGWFEWDFHATRGNLMFRGKLHAPANDIICTAVDDTDGTLLYNNQCLLADAQISVYQQGKLEAQLTSKGSTIFESVRRHKHPYVPVLG